MKDRIKKLRKELDLTQQEFADQLKVPRNTIAGYEVGKSNPSDAAINNLCRTFNVNETWLRDGTGEMFVEMDVEDQKISAFMKDILKADKKSFRRRIISGLSALDSEEWEILHSAFCKIVAS